MAVLWSRKGFIYAYQDSHQLLTSFNFIFILSSSFLHILGRKNQHTKTQTRKHQCGIFKQSMGARNRVGTGLSYRSARRHRLAELIPWIKSWVRSFSRKSRAFSGKSRAYLEKALLFLRLSSFSRLKKKYAHPV